MVMDVLEKIKSRIFGADPDSVAAYHTVLPKNVHVALKKDGEHLIAVVDKVGGKKIKGLLITEAKDLDSLVSSVNDLIYTYVKMPDNIRPYYGEVFQPEGYRRNAKELTLVKA